jgi:hypothetical protein
MGSKCLRLLILHITASFLPCPCQLPDGCWRAAFVFWRRSLVIAARGKYSKRSALGVLTPEPLIPATAVADCARRYLRVEHIQDIPLYQRNVAHVQPPPLG